MYDYSPNMAHLSNVLVDMADCIGVLPVLASVAVRWDYVAAKWDVSAQLDNDDEETAIDMIREWAATYFGSVALSEPFPNFDSGTHRTLSGSIALPSSRITVWTHVAVTSALALVAA